MSFTVGQEVRRCLGDLEGTQHKCRVRGQFTVGPRQRCRSGKWTSLRIGCAACTADDKAFCGLERGLVQIQRRVLKVASEEM